jgi:hypothetical protein
MRLGRSEIKECTLDSKLIVAQQIGYHKRAIDKIRCLLANRIGLPSAMATTTAKWH